MEPIIRHCFVMSPKDFSKANNNGDDVFLCEYEYDIHWHSFKRIADITSTEEVTGPGSLTIYAGGIMLSYFGSHIYFHDYLDAEGADSDDDWNDVEYIDCDSEYVIQYEEEKKNRSLTGPSWGHSLAATMTVLAAMRNLRSEVDAGSIKPHRFIKINGLKLASPENIYGVIYEALTGHRVSWKRALLLE